MVTFASIPIIGDVRSFPDIGSEDSIIIAIT